jgi:hypothetical protein
VVVKELRSLNTASGGSRSLAVGVLSLIVNVFSASGSVTAGSSGLASETVVSTRLVLTARESANRAFPSFAASKGSVAIASLRAVLWAIAKLGPKPHITPLDTTKAAPNIAGITSSEFHKVLNIKQVVIEFVP